MARYEHTGANTDWSGFSKEFYTGRQSSGVAQARTDAASGESAGNEGGRYQSHWNGRGYDFTWVPGHSAGNASPEGTLKSFKWVAAGAAVTALALFALTGRRGS